MSEFNVFGRGAIPIWEIAIAAGSTEVKKVADSPETFEVTIPLWVEGKNLNGEPLKLSRRLSIKILQSEGKWQIQSYEFHNDQPLTLQQQILTWLFWSFIGPILVFLLLWSQFGGTSESAGSARVIVNVLTLPLVGYVSFVCFGSVIAVVIGLIAYSVIVYLVIALWIALIS